MAVIVGKQIAIKCIADDSVCWQSAIIQHFDYLYEMKTFKLKNIKNNCATEIVDVVPLSMIGIGFHSFIDVLVYSITFTVSFFTGMLAASGMVLHEFPEGIITYLLLLRGGFSEKNP